MGFASGLERYPTPYFVYPFPSLKVSLKESNQSEGVIVIELPKKNFVWGWDIRTWSIGFVVHKVKELGTVVEINMLPLKFYWRLKG